ncbi:multidrug transporter [Marinobacter sp. CA1]|uniref:multidrug transporter n=1 Tax=Marinobacter sp. CA1 TaxID=2817656 RepID=UPI001D07FB53|nr:multidrug transporter [Marinobacter sp. CA1]MCG8517170.1 multidrug transporter [Pseudomonadales bacterium]UDL07170.1 multidrug transporter [Marinobacter sp. CA1]
MSYQSAMAVLAGIGAILLIAGLAFCLRPRWFFAWLKGTLALALLASGGYAVVVAAGLTQYQSLTGMRTVATVGVARLGPQLWQVTLETEAGKQGRYTLHGDQWQVDARIIHFGGPLTWMKVEPGYRLERLSGRYVSLEQERQATRSVVALNEAAWPDLWALDRQFNLPFVDGVYGNATFMPMADGALFDIRLSATGLAATPANTAAREAVQVWIH